MIPLALTRDDIADYVSALFLVYIILIFVNVLISWMPRMPYNRGAARGARLHHRDHRPVPEPLPPLPAADRRRRLRARPQPDHRRSSCCSSLQADRRRPDRTGERRGRPRLAPGAALCGLVVAARPGRQGGDRGAAWCPARRSTCSARSSSPSPTTAASPSASPAAAAAALIAAHRRWPWPWSAILFARDPTRPGMWVAVGPAGRRRARQPRRPGPRRRGDRLHRLPAWPPFNLADVAIIARGPPAGLASSCASRARAEVTEPELRIVHLDEALAVVDKPAGLVVHPAPSHQGPTLVDELAEILGGGEDPERPGIVHRLDKDTSGLLVVARDDEAHARSAGAGPARARSSASTWRWPGAARVAHRHDRRADRPRRAPAPPDGRLRRRLARGADPLQVLELLPARDLPGGRAWRPAAPTRSAPTSRRSATRWPATRPTAASRSYGLERQFLHAHRLAFAHPVSGEGLSLHLRAAGRPRGRAGCARAA